MEECIIIRKMIAADRYEIVTMMREFYTSPAVSTDGSEEIYAKDFEACIGECEYLEGYVFLENENICGYAMIAKGFSTEAGMICNWIEDLYIKDEYRGKGIGRQFFGYMEKMYPDSLHKLEVEPENEKAIQLYRKCGFEPLPYISMIR